MHFRIPGFFARWSVLRLSAFHFPSIALRVLPAAMVIVWAGAVLLTSGSAAASEQFALDRCTPARS